MDEKTVQELKKGFQDEIDALCDRITALETAGRPFAHPDLCKRMASNTRGDDSIIFQRDRATITLGDCKRIAALLGETK